jgi:hypothetical protein
VGDAVGYLPEDAAEQDKRHGNTNKTQTH